MEREENAYQAMHVDLSARYAGQYVAIHKGKLIDHDPSELALLRRLTARYPSEVVLLRQVLPLPEPDLFLRSIIWITTRPRAAPATGGAP